MKYRFTLLLLLLMTGMHLPARAPRMRGLSLVSPPRPVESDWTAPIRQLNADWVAVMPYAFSETGSTFVRFDSEFQWWGEKTDGVRQLIRKARAAGLQVMLKPMVWIHGSWPGQFRLDSDAAWEAWEADYRKYLLHMARVAEEEGVEALCIGTEFKESSLRRSAFWRSLAREIRQIYHGPLTYAANWDDFYLLDFWDELDFVGVDAYFPLSEARVPTVNALVRKWKQACELMKQYAAGKGKQILFTEFGYRSTWYCAWKQWELEHIRRSESVCLEAQTHAYTAFFQTAWEEDWLAGVFLWQWYLNHEKAGGMENSDFTPQRKPAEAVIREAFAKS